MELPLLWAGVSFRAQNGDPEGLLTAAAKVGLHLSAILPCPGGFQAECAAWRYRPLAALARRHRVRLRIQRRTGLYFLLRPLLRRRGLWAGLLVFLPVLLWSQNFIWSIDGTTLTAGQRARAAVLLSETDLLPGSYVTEQKLSAGEYALLKTGGFSWSSLNFANGRLVVEAAAAKAVPEIAAGTLHGIRAKHAGVILHTNLTSGTMLVSPGQTVEAGQGLIGTARTERDGTLIFQPAAGTVTARFEWEFEQSLPLRAEMEQLTGETFASYRFRFAGVTVSLPGIASLLSRHPASEASVQRTRHLQPELWGLEFPMLVEETTFYTTSHPTKTRTEDEALNLCRYHSRQALYSDFPDAEILAQKEDFSAENELFSYRVCYTITADICEENSRT